MDHIIIIAVAFLSSVIGSICGIGGGVIIKPVIDMLGVMSVAAGSFASGVTVLSMASFSLTSILRSGVDIEIEWKSSVPIAVGAVAGGIAGKHAFSLLHRIFNPNVTAATQSAILLVMTLLTIVYTINKDKVHMRNVDGIGVCLFIGLCLGAASSFLGIGGGPMNLAVLSYFFSMSNKKAAQNSLLIICFSQVASFVIALLSSSIPDIPVQIILGMICCGIGGASVGRKINSRINDRMVGQSFVLLLGIIAIVCIVNMKRYGWG